MSTSGWEQEHSFIGQLQNSNMTMPMAVGRDLIPAGDVYCQTGNPVPAIWSV